MDICGPANTEEVAQFVWMPGSHAGVCRQGEEEANPSMLCDGLMGMWSVERSEFEEHSHLSAIL